VRVPRSIGKAEAQFLRHRAPHFEALFAQRRQRSAGAAEL